MNTKENLVITISREVGSGGRTVGRALAEKLGVRYSDKQLIESLQKKFDLTVENIEKMKGKKKDWLEEFVNFVAPVPSSRMTLPYDTGLRIQDFIPTVTRDDVYQAECEIVKSIADEGPCVIAGRSAFFILAGRPNVLNVFITASDGNRIKRIMRRQNLSEEEAKEVMAKVDSARENFVKRYAGVSRYDARNYDLVINMDHVSEDEAVNLILSYAGRS